MEWKEQTVCREQAIQETVQRARAEFYAGEQMRLLSRWEFLLRQSRYVKKQWWILQAALLILLWGILQTADSGILVRRSLGVAAPLFVLLTLPEFWKNRSCNAMEVEGTALYSLRQIYAARLTLFALMDVLLLSLFFLGVQRSGTATLWELLVEFLLPFNVSCCISFSCLYCRRLCSETLCMALCGVWTAFWECLVLQDAWYMALSPAVWAALLAASFSLLCGCVIYGQRTWRNAWEVKQIWN